MGWLLNTWQESAARRELAALRDRLGLTLPDTGWAPALMAIVDQHAAAVRDILQLSVGQVGVVELAGYARGVQDVAMEAGWEPRAHSKETEDPDWRSDWVNLRLAAVCLLAATGTAAAINVGDLDSLMFF